MRRRQAADPTSRIYCFPHCGGSAGEYVRWGDQLPGLELSGVTLPGRGPRHREPPAASLSELATAIAHEVRFRPPYVLFGHSFGALLAYHVAHRLHDRDRPLPGLLILSAALPPHLPLDVPALSGLPDRVFLQRLAGRYGGVPAELSENPELAALVAPAYRADWAILERYTDPGLPPLGIPMLVLGGNRDRYSSRQLGQWVRHTTAEFQLRLLPGGHFYFRENPGLVLDILERHPLMPRPVRPGRLDSPRCRCC